MPAYNFVHILGIPMSCSLLIFNMGICGFLIICHYTQTIKGKSSLENVTQIKSS